jgi:aryl-alcohol dehydrogenase-like predicted oxidoreductase
MDYQLLGKTGITVSALGVGTGGPSRVGLRTGGDDENAKQLLRLAVDHGVNFIDTAGGYGTEELTGQAIKGLPRRELVLSTKISDYENLTGQTLEKSVDDRLAALGTDYIDVLHFHAVTAESYEWVRSELAPALLRCKEHGKIRATGITERFNYDPDHRMLTRALEDDIWDVMMIGYNILNQSARPVLFPGTLARGTGVLDMFAVRLALSKPDRLRAVMNELCEAGHVSRTELEEAGGTMEDPLGWVVRESDARTLPEAAYRFVRQEEAVHVTLCGTGSADHLLANIEAVQLPPLDGAVTEKLRRLFRNVDGITGQ